MPDTLFTPAHIAYIAGEEAPEETMIDVSCPLCETYRERAIEIQARAVVREQAIVVPQAIWRGVQYCLMAETAVAVAVWLLYEWVRRGM